MKTILVGLLCFYFVTQVHAQNDALRKKEFNVKKSIALEGYDPVSYFNGAPKEGKEEINYTFKGITYQFESPANQAKFKFSPEKYEPAYGGWCAYAMGESGEKVKIDPQTFKIVDGKLFLFYNFWGNNTLTSWNKNEKVLKGNADAHWSKIFR